MIELPLTGSPSSLADAAREPDFQPDPARLADSGPTLPHVVAWNLTRRCNLACAHCYISAGSWHAAHAELDTATCHRILDEVLEVNPAPMLILTGGEPLLRDDLEELARHGSEAGATVVVGTNGTRLTDRRIDSLMEAGVKGVAVSVDSLDARYHDRFRHGAARGKERDEGEHDGPREARERGGGRERGERGEGGENREGGNTLEDTLAAVDRCRAHALDFVIQTTLTRGNRHELSDLVAWAAEKGAVSFNLYFLVPTGRGEGMTGLDPDENEEVLAELAGLERRYRGRMMVRSKCQPQLMRHVHAADPDAPLLNYATRCPCGVHYCRITPEGKVTPCPYMPLEAGDLMETPFRQIWESSPVFDALRRGELGGRCGRCEYRKICGGCRARAYADTGDPLGPDDSCVHDPTGDVPMVEPPRPITYGTESEPSLPWTAEATERLERIPSFVRGVVTERVERFARERGYGEVDLEVMAEVRRSLPVDFSKRLPFFLRKGDEA